MPLVASIALNGAWLADLRTVACAFPTLPILIHHQGMARIADGPDSAGLREVLATAACPNVSVKASGFYYGTIKDRFTDIAPFGPKVSKKTKKIIAAKRKALIKGTFYEFAGPIYDQKGKLRIPKGKKPGICCGKKTLYGMDYLVRGIIGSAKG